MQDYLSRIQTDAKKKLFMLGTFLALSIFFQFLLKDAFSSKVSVIIGIIILYSVFTFFVLTKLQKRKPQLIIDVYFLSICLDIVFLTVIIYFLGGITWIAPFFYSLILVNIFWIFPEGKAFFLIGLSLFFLSSMVALQYLEILPTIYLFLPGEGSLQNLNYTILTVSGSLAVIIFLSYASDVYRRILNKQIEGLKRVQAQLKTAKESLEIDVVKKTKSLEEEKKNLESEVKKRTKELEEKKILSQERVKELEKFHTAAVERELEMVQLKEKIIKLKK
ncbi:hypothetical protein ACFL06_00420 [Patescibacteria group bacterium]